MPRRFKQLDTLALGGIILMLATGMPPQTGAAPSPTLAVTEEDSGKLLSVQTGQVVEISLNGNITTGYSWVAEPVKGKAVKQLGKVEYRRDNSAALGAPGRFVARFKAVAAGDASIKLNYIRPWEKNVPPAKVFTVDVAVE